MPDAKPNVWPQQFTFSLPDEVLLLMQANEKPLLDLTNNVLVGEARLESVASSGIEALGFFIHAENKFLGEEHALLTATRLKGQFFPLNVKLHPTLPGETVFVIVDDYKSFELVFRKLLKSPVTTERVQYLLSRSLGIRQEDVV